MPHTNRRKKHAPAKRLEVTDDDGWTRVTTTNHERRRPYAIGGSAALLQNQERTWKTTPEADATVQRVRQEYERVREQWTASDSCTALVSSLQEKLLLEKVEMDRCLIFGSGSFCGLRQGWISRKQSAMCQLAVLQTMQSTIEETSGRTLEIYAQDPAYNDVDVEFLKDLAIEVAEDPGGFDLVTGKSLVYTPGAEYHVEMEVLKRKPAVLLTGKLNWLWRNEKGLACTNRVSARVGSCQIPLGEVDDSGDNAHQHAAQQMQQDLEGDCQTLEAFLQIMQETKLPSLDFKDNPFMDQHLYWPQPQDDGEHKRPQDSVE